MSRKPRGGRIYSQIIALLPHSRPSSTLKSCRSSVRAVASVRILKFAGPLEGIGDDKKDSNLKDARMSGYRPCVHSICRRLRDPSRSLFLSVYLSLVTRIYRSYDQRALTPSSELFVKKFCTKKLNPVTLFFLSSERVTHKEKITIDILWAPYLVIV